MEIRDCLHRTAVAGLCLRVVVLVVLLVQVVSVGLVVLLRLALYLELLLPLAVPLLLQELPLTIHLQVDFVQLLVELLLQPTAGILLHHLGQKSILLLTLRIHHRRLNGSAAQSCKNSDSNCINVIGLVGTGR